MIKLVRLDYRLLHGQVVFAWTGHVSAQRIIVVDDEAANDDLKKSALTHRGEAEHLPPGEGPGQDAQGGNPE